MRIINDPQIEILVEYGNERLRNAIANSIFVCYVFIGIPLLHPEWVSAAMKWIDGLL